MSVEYGWIGTLDGTKTIKFTRGSSTVTTMKIANYLKKELDAKLPKDRGLDIRSKTLYVVEDTPYYILSISAHGSTWAVYPFVNEKLTSGYVIFTKEINDNEISLWIIPVEKIQSWIANPVNPIKPTERRSAGKYYSIGQKTVDKLWKESFGGKYSEPFSGGLSDVTKQLGEFIRGNK